MERNFTEQELDEILFNYRTIGKKEAKSFALPIEVLRKIDMSNVSFDNFCAYHVNFSGMTGVKIDPNKLYKKNKKFYNIDIKNNNIILFALLIFILDDYKDSVIASSSYLNDVITKTSHDINMKLVEGRIYSSDVFYEKNNDYKQKVREHNVLGVEMETFSLFNNARVLGKNVTALLTVSDSFCFTDKMNSEEREKNLNDMIILSLESCLKL